MNLELLDRAAGKTTCQVLEAGGYALAGTGAVGIVTGGVGFVTMGVGAAMLLAANYGCAEMPLGDAEDSLTTGCIQVATRGAIQVDWVDGTTFDAFPPGNMNYSAGQNAQKIKSVRIQEVPQSQSPYWVYVEWEGPDGQQYSDQQYTFRTKEEAQSVKWSIRPFNGDCTATSPETKPLPPEMFEPRPYTDEITNCNFNITFQGMAQPVPGGPVKPVYLLQQAGEQRAGGGVMGGCNWPDTIFMPSDGGGGGSGGEPPVYLPVPDGPTPPNGPDGVPWWAGPLLGAATNAALQLIGRELANMSEPDFEPGSFTMVAPCDVNEDGSPQARTWEFPKASFQQRMNAHQVAMMDMLQQHLVWKTPTCGGDEQQPGEGDWRTVSFRSDKTSPYGKSRLRKRFRYRSTSGWSYDALINHWKDFVWESGPVVVEHTGSSWGAPKVWAATADEGKRVIRHAAGEAGIDPDQVGRWSISGSRSSRLGVSDTMRVETKGGYYWITARDGSDARPLVAKVPHTVSGFDTTE